MGELQVLRMPPLPGSPQAQTSKGQSYAYPKTGFNQVELTVKRGQRGQGSTCEVKAGTQVITITQVRLGDKTNPLQAEVGTWYQGVTLPTLEKVLDAIVDAIDLIGTPVQENTNGPSQYPFKLDCIGDGPLPSQTFYAGIAGNGSQVVVKDQYAAEGSPEKAMTKEEFGKFKETRSQLQSVMAGLSRNSDVSVHQSPNWPYVVTVGGQTCGVRQTVDNTILVATEQKQLSFSTARDVQNYFSARAEIQAAGKRQGIALTASQHEGYEYVLTLNGAQNLYLNIDEGGNIVVYNSTTKTSYSYTQKEFKALINQIRSYSRQFTGRTTQARGYAYRTVGSTTLSHVFGTTPSDRSGRDGRYEARVHNYASNRTVDFYSPRTYQDYCECVAAVDTPSDCLTLTKGQDPYVLAINTPGQEFSVQILDEGKISVSNGKQTKVMTAKEYSLWKTKVNDFAQTLELVPNRLSGVSPYHLNLGGGLDLCIEVTLDGTAKVTNEKGLEVTLEHGVQLERLISNAQALEVYAVDGKRVNFQRNQEHNQFEVTYKHKSQKKKVDPHCVGIWFNEEGNIQMGDPTNPQSGVGLVFADVDAFDDYMQGIKEEMTSHSMWQRNGAKRRRAKTAVRKEVKASRITTVDAGTATIELEVTSKAGKHFNKDVLSPRHRTCIVEVRVNGESGNGKKLKETQKVNIAITYDGNFRVGGVITDNLADAMRVLVQNTAAQHGLEDVDVSSMGSSLSGSRSNLSSGSTSPLLGKSPRTHQRFSLWQAGYGRRPHSPAHSLEDVLVDAGQWPQGDGKWSPLWGGQRANPLFQPYQ